MSRFFGNYFTENNEEESITSEEDEIQEEEQEEEQTGSNQESQISLLMNTLIQNLKDKKYYEAILIVEKLHTLIEAAPNLPESLYLSFTEASSLIPKDNQKLKAAILHLFDDDPIPSNELIETTDSNDQPIESSKKVSWFESSDDDEVDEIKRKYEDNDALSVARRQAKIEQQKQQEAHSLLESFWNRPITDESAAAEVTKAREQRLLGYHYETTARYQQLLESVKSEALKFFIKTEIILSIGATPITKPIPATDWYIITNLFQETEFDDLRPFVPLLQRLERDFWTRLCDLRHMFSPETSRITSFEPEFLDIVNITSGDLLEKGTDADKANACRLQMIILRHMYRSPQFNIIPLASATLSLINYLPEKFLDPNEDPKATSQNSNASEIFKPSYLNYLTTKSSNERFETKVTTALFVATHLALKDETGPAAKILRSIPRIPSNCSLAQIFFNRALALVGISAFSLGEYRLCTRSMKNFTDIFEINRMLGQHPMLFPNREVIDAGAVLTVQLLAAVILDLPFLSIRFPDEGKLLVPQRLHQILLRELPDHVETAEQRIIAAVRFAVKGDWCGAYNTIENDVSKYIGDPEQFILDLKKTSLCCYLLSALVYHEKVNIDFLMTKFSLSEWDVRDSVKTMIAGHAPVEGAVIKFPAELTQDMKVIIFKKPTKTSSPADFGRVIQNSKIKAKYIASDEEIQARRDAKAKAIAMVEKQVEDIEAKTMKQRVYSNRTKQGKK